MRKHPGNCKMESAAVGFWKFNYDTAIDKHETFEF